jgi:hypothetical protein
MIMRATRNLAVAVFAAGGIAAAAPPEVKFSPLESYTVVYTVSGPQSGVVTQHSRKYGLEQSQVNDLGLGNNARNRVQLITLGDRIISYDPLTRRAASTANPGYDDLIMAARGKTDAELPAALLRTLSFEPTGRMQNLAGETCLMWESRRLAQSRCVTADGIALQTRLMLPGATVVQTAQTVRRREPGPDAAYMVPVGTAVPNVQSLTELPGVGR